MSYRFLAITLHYGVDMARTLSLEAHDKVLASAQALLYERGFEGFTIDAVAVHSGVAKTTIYRHFPGRHTLLIATLDAMIAPVPTPNTGSLHNDLLELFLQRLPIAEDPHLRLIVMGLLNASATDPDLQRVAAAMKDQRTEPIRTIVQLAMGRGEIPTTTDVNLAIDVIEGPLFFHAFVRQLPLDEGQLEALIVHAVAGLKHST